MKKTNPKLSKAIEEHAADILASKDFQKQKTFMQHGDMTTYNPWFAPRCFTITIYMTGTTAVAQSAATFIAFVTHAKPQTTPKKNSILQREKSA